MAEKTLKEDGVMSSTRKERPRLRKIMLVKSSIRSMLVRKIQQSDREGESIDKANEKCENDESLYFLKMNLPYSDKGSCG